MINFGNMRLGLKFLLYSIILLSYSPSNSLQKMSLTENIQISPTSWENELSGLQKNDPLSNAIFDYNTSHLTEKVIQESLFGLEETILDLKEKEVFAKIMLVSLENAKGHIFLTSLYSSANNHRERKPVPKNEPSGTLLFGSVNHLNSRGYSFIFSYARDLREYSIVVKHFIIITNSNVTYHDKKLMKYYSIRKKAPPFVGELKC